MAVIQPDADPRSVIRNGDMTRFQVIVVTLCILICALDGFDVLVVAFTAPAIAGDFNLNPTDLGILFSAGLAGMGLGALFIAPLGDKLGRRATVLLCLAILAIGMLASAMVRDLTELALLRLFTGLGIGGVLANINIVVAEYASDRRRHLSIALMSLGYPVGASLGGLISVYLIAAFGWRSVFVFGGLVAVVLVPAVLAFMPESIDYLIARRPKDALAKVNRVMARMGRPVLNALPAPQRPEEAPNASLFMIFRPPYATGTLAACVAYFAVMMTCYFFLSWTPKMLTQLGLSISGGISGSLLMNIGGVIGCLLFGFYAKSIGTRRLSAAFMVGLFVTASIFGIVPADTGALLTAALAIGFCLYTSINALYSVIPAVFPATVRTTGTGLAMSIGRLGAVTGPFLAGLLMSAGWDRPAYCLVLAAPVLVAAASLYWVRSFNEAAPVLPQPEDGFAPGASVRS